MTSSQWGQVERLEQRSERRLDASRSYDSVIRAAKRAQRGHDAAALTAWADTLDPDGRAIALEAADLLREQA